MVGSTTLSKICNKVLNGQNIVRIHFGSREWPFKISHFRKLDVQFYLKKLESNFLSFLNARRLFCKMIFHSLTNYGTWTEIWNQFGTYSCIQCKSNWKLRSWIYLLCYCMIYIQFRNVDVPVLPKKWSWQFLMWPNVICWYYLILHKTVHSQRKVPLIL